MNGWVHELHALAAGGQPAVLATLVSTRGSSPRGSGVKMIVTSDACYGSIGGGQLEHRCIARARAMLNDGGEPVLLEKYVLGAPLDQCCGGAVEVLFETLAGGMPAWLQELRNAGPETGRILLATALPGKPHEKRLIHPDGMPDSGGLPVETLEAIRKMPADATGARVAGGMLLEFVNTPDLHIAVFGAGHVGTALVSILAPLEADIRWIDDREGMFTRVPDGVLPIRAKIPASEVGAMPPGSFYLVMTHSHALDLGICAAILERGDAAYCGLIGSATKRRRFEKHFLELGLDRTRIDGLVCPIGIGGIGGKQPAVIAIATAAEILRVYEGHGLGREAKS